MRDTGVIVVVLVFNDPAQAAVRRCSTNGVWLVVENPILRTDPTFCLPIGALVPGRGALPSRHCLATATACPHCNARCPETMKPPSASAVVEFEVSDGSWCPYDDHEVVRQLLAGRQQTDPRPVVFARRSFEYMVDIAARIQTNRTTGTVRRIRFR